MFASEDLNMGLKVITVRCAYLQCNYKLLYTMVLVRNGTPGIQGEVTNIQSSNTLHRTEQSLTETQAFHSEGKIQGGAAVRNPQWGTRSEYHPGGENKINKEQGEGGKREKEREREKRKEKTTNKPTSQGGPPPCPMTVPYTEDWRDMVLARKHGKHCRCVCCGGRDFTQAEMGLTAIWPQFHMDH